MKFESAYKMNLQATGRVTPTQSDQHKQHCYKSNCYKPKNYENIQSYSYWREGMHGKQHNFLEITDRCFEQNYWKNNIHKEQKDF